MNLEQLAFATSTLLSVGFDMEFTLWIKNICVINLSN